MKQQYLIIGLNVIGFICCVTGLLAVLLLDCKEVQRPSTCAHLVVVSYVDLKHLGTRLSQSL